MRLRTGRGRSVDMGGVGVVYRGSTSTMYLGRDGSRRIDGFYAVMMDGRTEGGTGVWHRRVPPGLV